MEADDTSSVKRARRLLNGAQVILDATSRSWQEEGLIWWTEEPTGRPLSIRLRGSDRSHERRVAVHCCSGRR